MLVSQVVIVVVDSCLLWKISFQVWLILSPYDVVWGAGIARGFI